MSKTKDYQSIKKAFIETLHFRHACKLFDETKIISKEDFDFILESGRLSPSSFGLEPWKLIVVENKDLAKDLLKVVWGGQGKFGFASHVVLMMAKTSYFLHYKSDYLNYMFKDIHKFPQDMVEFRKNLVKTHQLEHYDFLKDKQLLAQWACRQVYIALGQMMIAAALIDIDSCPIEGFAIKPVQQYLKSKFDISADQYYPACFVAFGYRKNPAKLKTRLPMDEIVQRY